MKALNKFNDYTLYEVAHSVQRLCSLMPVNDFNMYSLNHFSKIPYVIHYIYKYTKNLITSLYIDVVPDQSK